MGSIHEASFDVKKIAIIGAGPAGLSAAKYLRAQGAFESIVVYEQQDQVGGMWNYSELVPKEPPAPQEDPFYPPDPPVSRKFGPPVFLSPMYDDLHANIPESIMRFSDTSFSSDALLFPSRERILDYLAQYAEDVKDLIAFCVEVNRVSLRVEGGKEVWDLELKSTFDGKVRNQTFDAVVVANGHYSIPFIPDMKNMRQFSQAYPSIITHSKHYRTADPFTDKKTIVVGNGPSGIDIVRQINLVSKGKAILSVRTPTPAGKLAHAGCDEAAEIDEFLVEERGVRFKDGRVEIGIEAIVFCTGFLYSYPFLPDIQHKLITSGRGVHGLYQHLFHIDHPTLAFPALNMKAAPWPLSEAQAAALGAVWSNNIPLPSVETMKKWERDLFEKQGEALHVFTTPLTDGYYINELHDWVKSSEQKGKEPPFWDDELLWTRSIYADAKLRFEQQGCKAHTLAELGYHYDPDWRSEQKERSL